MDEEREGCEDKAALTMKTLAPIHGWVQGKARQGSQTTEIEDVAAGFFE